MNLFVILINILCLFPFSQSQKRVKIIRNEMSKNMANFAIGEAVMALENNLNNKDMAKELTTSFQEQYGSHWMSLVGSESDVSYFEAAPNSTIWFMIENYQIILFKPVERTETSFIKEAKKANAVLTVIKNEMTESMKEHALVISLIAIKNFDDFKSISANISSSMETLYGYHWVCSVSSKLNEISSKYIGKTFLVFTIEDISVTMFQTGVPDVKVN